MNKILQLAYEHGLYAQGVPDTWDETALDSFGKTLVQMCVNRCNELAAESFDTAKSEFVTQHGKDIHMAMGMGAVSCASTLIHEFELPEIPDKM